MPSKQKKLIKLLFRLVNRGDITTIFDLGHFALELGITPNCEDILRQFAFKKRLPWVDNIYLKDEVYNGTFNFEANQCHLKT